VLIYGIVLMIALVAIGSLAVDYARVQAVKTDLQKAADATARGSLALYQSYDLSTAQTYGAYIPTSPYNPVESGTGVQPTVTITWGKWDSTTKTFTAGNFAPPAVKVTISRTAANSNGVPLTLASIFGRKTCDVSTTSIAAVANVPAQTISVPGTGDPWLSGMPDGSTASYDDTAPTASPPMMTIPAGATGYLTFTNVSGTVAHGSGLYNGPEGNTSSIYSHGADSPGGPTPAAENGIADAVAPINALMGVFLDDNQPNTTSAPSTRNYSTSASRDQTSYSDIQLKQPFFIGDGVTSTGTVQQFKIPPGATRLYLGPMDGYEWKNNLGSFSVTITQVQVISLVK
jgi:hypothetical protein